MSEVANQLAEVLFRIAPPEYPMMLVEGPIPLDALVLDIGEPDDAPGRPPTEEEIAERKRWNAQVAELEKQYPDFDRAAHWSGIIGS